MGVVISYDFLCKDKACVKRVIDGVFNKAQELKAKDPRVDIFRVTEKDIFVNVDPECETFELTFGTYAEKQQRYKEKGWDYELVTLTGHRKENVPAYSIFTRQKGETEWYLEKFQTGGKQYEDKDDAVRMKDILKRMDGSFEYRVKPIKTSWFRDIPTEPIYGPEGYQTSHFTKTQYAGDEAHINVCKLVDTARRLADGHHVSDDADYCGDKDDWDERKIGKAMDENLKVIGKIAGDLKAAGWNEDQLGGSGFEQVRRKGR